MICSLDEYFEKRKKKSLDEAFEYARCIFEREHRRPVPADFIEEFPYFVDGRNIDHYADIPIRSQLRDSYEIWIKVHRRVYDSFEDFLKAAGL